MAVVARAHWWGRQAAMLAWCMLSLIAILQNAQAAVPQCTSSLDSSARVAVIGSGIGGSSAAFFVREALGNKAAIDVYEASETVGGRVASVNFAAEIFEAGASIIHQRNEYMKRFSKLLGLQEGVPQGVAGQVGIWDGNSFVYQDSGWGWWDALRLWWRYGNSLFRVGSATQQTLDGFCRIYELQKQGVAYESVQELLIALDLYDLTQLRLDAWLQGAEIGAPDNFVVELATAMTRNNYGQNVTLNALAGAVVLSASRDAVWRVQGGNQQVPTGLLDRANATINLSTRVTAITQLPASDVNPLSKYIVEYSKDGSVSFVEYDAVVVAAPLESAAIRLDLPQKSDIPDRSYQRTVATFVRGLMNPAYFRLKGDLPAFVVTEEIPELPFLSVNVLKKGSVPGAHSVYKLFSRELLSNAVLDKLFIVRDEVAVWDWLAYPHFNPPEEFAPIVLDAGVFYINAIESAASAMEVSAVGAKNVALLLEGKLHADALLQQSWCEASTDYVASFYDVAPDS
eukprot:jgi/Chlat1/7766/Chrsp66S07228